MARVGGASLDTGRHPIFRRQVLVVDPVHAEGALPHDALIWIVFPCSIGAGPGTELAADAGIWIDEHDAVLFTFEGGTGRADGHAGRLFAVQAGAGDMDAPTFRPFTRFVAVNPVEPDAERLGFIGIDVGQRCRPALIVPFLAGDGAGLPAHTAIEVDHQAELLLPRPAAVRQRSHLLFLPLAGRSFSRSGTPGGRGSVSN